VLLNGDGGLSLCQHCSVVSVPRILILILILIPRRPCAADQLRRIGGGGNVEVPACAHDARKRMG